MKDEPHPTDFGDRPTVPSPADRGAHSGHIGPYKILELLGRGGFGAVYLAEQTSPVQRQVALKVLRAGPDTGALLARFEAERQALALMDHPGVAQVYDAGSTPEGDSYFAMELVRGRSITRYCREHKLGPGQRVELLIQVCEAVQHAHTKGVIHRDLKPANILVESVDDRPVAKVIDFGVAKALHSPLGSSTIMTEQGQLLGTPDYMSPEQASGSPNIDTRTDVYALGVLLYELLSGVTPYDPAALREGGYVEMIRRLATIEPERPSTRLRSLMALSAQPPLAGVNPDEFLEALRNDLDWVALKCLEKDPALRYESPGQLAADLRRFLAGDALVAGPASVGYRTRKFIKRHRAGVAVAGAIVVLLVAAITGTSLGLIHALDQRAIAEEQARIAQSASEQSEAVTQFLSDMLEAPSPDEHGKDASVRAVLDAAGANLQKRFADRPQVEARLRHTVGRAYWSLGELDEANSHLEAAHRLYTTLFGPSDTRTIRAGANLGGLRLAQGRVEDAGALFSSCLDIARKTRPDSDELIIGLTNNLAAIKARVGKREEALALYSRAVAGATHTLGPDHPTTLGATINLAQTLVSTGRDAEAEPMLAEARERWLKAHGENHPGTLTCESILADLRMRQGRTQEAKDMQLRIFKARSTVLGPDHPETISTQIYLAEFLALGGDLDEAIRQATDVWTRSRRALGEVHPWSVLAANKVIAILEAAGWPASAESTLSGVVSHLRAAAESGLSAGDTNDIAMALVTVKPERLRDPVTASNLAAKAIELDRADGGTNLWRFLDTLALCQFHAGQPSLAAATQREAIRLIPQEGAPHRKEMQESLARYEAAERTP